jgi:glycosyltransferase involved in cell wall biosynthesis
MSSPPSPTPFFAIITPTYNRAALVRRAIASALAQDFTSFEIIVVDSGSTDGTRDVVQELAARDRRVRLVCEEKPRGVCPARNKGVDNANGQWIVLLDSDDELPPGTLTVLRERIAAAPDADHHRFMCRWDDGSFSPRPPLIEEEWDYDGYLRFLERCSGGGSTEMMSCIRAATFREIRFPEDRSYETLYHLDFASRFMTRSHAQVARLYHTDAEDQNSFVPNPRHWLRVAPDVARSLNEVVARHGPRMHVVAPNAFDEMLRSAAKFNFLAGDRRRGVGLLLRLWSRRPVVPLSWLVFLFGILGPMPLAWVDGIRFRMHLQRVRRRPAP